MSYSSNPLLLKARVDAVHLVVEDHLPVAIAARESGIHRTTPWRILNANVHLTNDKRPSRIPSSATVSSFRLSAYTWRIPTCSSRPHLLPNSVWPLCSHCPCLLQEIRHARIADHRPLRTQQIRPARQTQVETGLPATSSSADGR